MTLAEARQARAECQALLAKGIDLKVRCDELEGKEKAKLDITLVRVASEWFELKKKKVTPDYADNIIRSLPLR